MDEVLLENLALKFAELFRNLQGLHEQSEKVQADNDHLQQLIREEAEQLQQTDESDEDEGALEDAQMRCQALLERKR